MLKFSQKSITGKVYKTILDNALINENDKVIVALSGGPDSVCLFNLLIDLKEKINFDLAACHFNHRLRGAESDRDEKFVRKICEEKGIDCHFGGAPGKNLYKNEEMAREARYVFFEKISQESRGAKVVLAHNQNDLSETYLMRLIRGTGLKGLCSIPLSRKNFIRPLLFVNRKEIESYLGEKKLKFRLDKSNLSLKYRRNQIRHEVIPLLARINPNIVETTANASLHAQDDYDYIQVATRQAFGDICLSEDDKKIILDHKKWLVLHPSLQKSLMRFSIDRLDSLLDLSVKQLLEVDEILKKRVGGKVKVLPRSLRVQYEDDKIVLLKN